MKNLVYIMLLFAGFTFAQEDKEEKEKQRLKDLKESVNYTWDGNKALSEKDFVDAEADYRKAIAKSGENSAAPYNLGNAYYSKESYGEAFSRYKQAGELTTNSKEDKHKAYHNMGNVFMKEKQYEKAVEAYKQALRNDFTDEETRYNLALAQELLKKQQEEDKKNQDKDDKDKDNKEDKKDQNEDKKEGDNKDDQNKDKGDEGDKEQEENKEGDGDKKEEEKKQPNKGDKPEEKKEQQPQQRQSQLSPQQVQNLLEAMQNEEKKVQDKMDAQKVKGVKTKNEKDW